MHLLVGQLSLRGPRSRGKGLPLHRSPPCYVLCRWVDVPFRQRLASCSYLHGTARHWSVMFAAVECTDARTCALSTRTSRHTTLALRSTMAGLAQPCSCTRCSTCVAACRDACGSRRSGGAPASSSQPHSSSARSTLWNACSAASSYKRRSARVFTFFPLLHTCNEDMSAA